MIRLAPMEKPSKLKDTDLCVMCGMCLPLCPTYQLYQTETESPRGRIALMQAIDQQRIKADSSALLHIDHCLGCLNCETLCPSQVPYGKLIDEFRNQYNKSIKKPYLSRLILKQATKTNAIESLTALSQKPLVKQLLQITSKFTNQPIAPSKTSAAKFKSFYAGNYSQTEDCRGEVSLFSGCSGKAFEHNAIHDAIIILNQLKFDVQLAEQQPCCGALHQHNGQQKIAHQLADEIRSGFKLQTILFFSPACGAQLKQIDDVKAIDIRAFILAQLQQQPLKFSPQAKAVALHESCSHRNMLKLKSLNSDLLNYIPDLQIIQSNQPALCCGAGGIQSINYPQQAQALLEEKLHSYDFSQTDILVSDNMGCSQHIKPALSAYNPDIEVMHPISFLARQLCTNVENN